MRTAMTFAAVMVVGALVGIGLKQATSGDGEPRPSAVELSVDQQRARLAGAPGALAAIHARAGELIPGAKKALARELEMVSGRPAVVNVWASWCAPCNEEAPVIQRVALDFGKQVAFLGVNLRDSDDGARAFLRRFPVSFPSVLDPDGQIYNDWGLAGQPATAFYDAAGKRTFVHQGPYTSTAAFEDDVRRYALGTTS